MGWGGGGGGTVGPPGSLTIVCDADREAETEANSEGKATGMRTHVHLQTTSNRQETPADTGQTERRHTGF